MLSCRRPTTKLERRFGRFVTCLTYSTARKRHVALPLRTSLCATAFDRLRHLFDEASGLTAVLVWLLQYHLNCCFFSTQACRCARKLQDCVFPRQTFAKPHGAISSAIFPAPHGCFVPKCETVWVHPLVHVKFQDQYWPAPGARSAAIPVAHEATVGCYLLHGELVGPFDSNERCLCPQLPDTLFTTGVTEHFRFFSWTCRLFPWCSQQLCIGWIFLLKVNCFFRISYFGRARTPARRRERFPLVFFVGTNSTSASHLFGHTLPQCRFVRFSSIGQTSLRLVDRSGEGNNQGVGFGVWVKCAEEVKPRELQRLRVRRSVPNVRWVLFRHKLDGSSLEPREKNSCAVVSDVRGFGVVFTLPVVYKRIDTACKRNTLQLGLKK